ncbi:MAG: hypothetical protein GTO63_10675 [Anaerolineae bacterium]|nr:hypothetical protein [Anaerolineae bacterium]NIQ78330.1 hypothetical protein [Anaerolineae bacterium]
MFSGGVPGETPPPKERIIPQEIAEDTEKLLLAAGPLEQAGVCCINMDYGTPDDNIFAMFEMVERYRRYGA